MKSASRILTLVAVGGFFLLASCSFYVVETGEVAVEKTLGTVDLDEVGEGVHWRLPLVTTADTFVTKEISFDLKDLRPKAADNLSLEDLDVTIYYRMEPGKVAETDVKYSGSRGHNPDGGFSPAFELVWREARGAAYDAVAKIDSLSLHKQREALGDNIASLLQARLEGSDPGVFAVTRVIIRALNTDPSIERSIQLAVEFEKKLEAKKLEVEIAQQEAMIEIERAKGIAKANDIINASLTAEYLQHEINLALRGFADNEGSVVVIPANMQGLDLMLNTKTGKK